MPTITHPKVYIASALSALTLLSTTLLSTGCATAPVDATRAKTTQPAKYKSYNTQRIRNILYQQHRAWKGTPYLFGGTNHKGIDCSALVQRVINEQFNQSLPRTTKQQATIGYAIKRSQLRAGDLVFFRTGKNARHVGIYIEDGKFLHASVKAGVKINKLSDYYWRDRYWQARRIGVR